MYTSMWPNATAVRDERNRKCYNGFTPMTSQRKRDLDPCVRGPVRVCVCCTFN